MAPRKTERTIRTRVLAVLLALSVIGMVAALGHHELQQGQMRDRLVLAADLKLLSQRVTTAALEAASGRPGGFERIEALRGEFDMRLQNLRNGSGRFGPVSAAIEPALAEVDQLWAVTRDDVRRIVEGRDAIDSINDLSAEIAAVSPDLAQLSDDVARRVATLGEPGNQVYLASRQLMLIQRIGSSLTEVLGGGALAASAIDRFRRDAILFGRVLLGLRDGFEPLGVEAIDDPDVQERLDRIAQEFERLSRSVDGIVELSSLVFGIDDAATAVETRSMDLLGATTALEDRIAQQANQLRIYAYLGFAFAALALLLLILIGVYAYRDTRRSLESTERQNARNQQAILRLLDEVMSLAEGDLTVNATVSEDFTGAIADSLNYAIASLRDLVATINTIASNLAGVARRSQDEVLAVSVRSEKQAQSILQANTAIGEVARAVEQVAVDANRSAEVALRSVSKAGTGADTVRRTITGMNTIREQIQETAKRIKRLGESSQEVGDIIGLINDIAEQTNVLALNAAIQASAAGEAGRGFAVVADEVQRLAERSASATRQVEGLVKAIQADTNEAIYSMERSTANVVDGAELAQAAGEALTEIETESQTLAELIQRMSRAATEQSERTRNVSGDMDEIRALTVETTSAARVSATSIGDLVALSADLERSVSGFRLPSDHLPDSQVAASEPSLRAPFQSDHDEADKPRRPSDRRLGR